MLLAGLLLVFILDYTRPDDLLPFIASLKLYALVPVLVFVAALAANTRTPNEIIWRADISKLLMWLFVCITISTVAAMRRDIAWTTWQGVLGYMFLFFMIAKGCDYIDKLKWVFRTLIAIHVWLALLNPALLTDPTQRSYIPGTAFLSDGNDFSLSVVIVLPMCLFLYQTSKGVWEKVFCVLSSLILFGAIMGTQSRGATLGVLAVVFYLWTLSQKKGRGMVFIVAGLIVAIAIASDAYLSRIETIARPTDGSAQARLVAWQAGIGMANRRPLTGVGPYNFGHAFGGWYSRPGLPRMNAHSVYFQALGDLGYPGFLVLLWLLWSLFRGNQKLIKSTSPRGDPKVVLYRRLMIAVNASLVGFAVSGAFISVLFYPHIWVICGTTLAARRLFIMDCPAHEHASSATRPAGRRASQRVGVGKRRHL